MVIAAFQFDARIAFLILVAGAAISVGQAVSGLVRMGTAKRNVNKRLAVAERAGSLGELVIELRKQRGYGADGQSLLKWDWFADLIIRSGVTYDPRRWVMVVVGVALGVWLLVFLLFHNALFGIPAGLLAGALGPLMFLNLKAGNRAKALGAQLPNALEVIVRSLEAGHPVPTAVGLVGREMPDPIGSEFGMAADEIAYGATLEQAVARIADRCRHPDVDLFAANIRLQERSGGNLTGLLKTLARTVRERQKMRMKVKAASAEGNASAIILTAAPFCVFIFLWVASPHFYGDVINERPIQIGLGLLLGWMGVGNIIMRKMIDMRI
ncbi:MAG: type II secretion system F family protein [Caulobacteraceae bacterium]